MYYWFTAGSVQRQSGRGDMSPQAQDAPLPPPQAGSQVGPYYHCYSRWKKHKEPDGACDVHVAHVPRDCMPKDHPVDPGTQTHLSLQTNTILLAARVDMFLQPLVGLVAPAAVVVASPVGCLQRCRCCSYRCSSSYIPEGCCKKVGDSLNVET
ncbi:hypothetical protein F5H01DRAFT_349410 [Linnemannia elongata]|nr:hypothetical protein F5H01DRAFT_349410 [Linnemannia elongata]